MRNRRIKNVLVTGGIVAILVASAACSSSSSPNTNSTQSPTATATQSPTATATATATQSAGAQATTGTNKSPSVDLAASVIDSIASDPQMAAQVPAAIRSTGLQVSSGVGYAPMEMFGQDNKTIYGIDPAIARAIGNRLGVKVTLINADFGSQIPGIISGRYNMIMSTMTDTATRQKQIDFLDYLSDSQGFVVKGGNPDNINHPSDLCGKTVAVVDNGTAFQLATQYSSDCTSAGKQSINILKFTDDQVAILQIKSGRAVADINDYPVAAYRAKTDPSYGAVLIPGTASPLGIGMSKKDQPLRDVVKSALTSLISDGTYGKILQAWGLSDMAVKSVVVNGGK